jgi:hypothetical protein
MKQVMCKTLTVLAITLVLVMVSAPAFAQDNSTYGVTYYSNANPAVVIPDGVKPLAVLPPDATVRVINDGNTGGNLCAAFYVFDDSQEMQECCSCPVSADGLISESVNRYLLANSLTSFVNRRGVIKVVSTNAPSGVCNPTNGAATAGIRGWATHIQRGTSPAFVVTETPLHDSNLSAAELASLQQFCSFEIILGSGRGTCYCGAEDNAF